MSDLGGSHLSDDFDRRGKPSPKARLSTDPLMGLHKKVIVSPRKTLPAGPGHHSMVLPAEMVDTGLHLVRAAERA